MARYIDADLLIEHIIYDCDLGAEMQTVGADKAVIDLVNKQIPTDVVEQEKIDKAIEEIESQQKFNIECDGESDLGIAIQIIRKHLGEVEE